MPLRDLFRNQSNNERKAISSTILVFGAGTFINATQNKDIVTLQKCLQAGFSPDQSDPITKATPLHIAVESANLHAVRLLLQAGAQVNLCDSNLSMPLHIAASMGYEEIAQVLLMHGANMFKRDNTGRNSFHLAVSTGNNRLVQHFLSLIDFEENIVHLPDAQNWTPLMCACANNHPSTCALLLCHGASLCPINDRGMNILHVAAFLGSLPIIHELLLHTSLEYDLIIKILNQGDNLNQTPLFYACMEGHLEVALIFLHAGANPYYLDNNNQTCLHAMLSSSIILKRHIRLFYRFIQFVDFRFHQDILNRTLLDLAYLNKIQTIIYLLTLLNYQCNYHIISYDKSIHNSLKPILSLRHLCILYFKRSIIYHRNKIQSAQHTLLCNALRQCFQIHPNIDNECNDTFYRKGFDDISITNKKALKSKKSRKTLNSSSSIQNNIEQHVQQTQSNWSILPNRFKIHRTLSSQQELNTLLINSPQSSSSLLTNHDHPLKNLALQMLRSSSKLNDLLDFPSLDNSQLLDDDMKTVMNDYNLSIIDSSNQI